MIGNFAPCAVLRKSVEARGCPIVCSVRAVYLFFAVEVFYRDTSQGIALSSPGMSPTITLDHRDAKLNWRHHVAVWLWIGWLFFYVIVLAVLPVGLYFGFVAQHRGIQLAMYWFFGIMGVLMVIPCEEKLQPKWAINLGSWMTRHAAAYFRVRVIIEDAEALKLAKPAFFVLEPHDVLPLSIISFSDATESMTKVGHSCMGCITSVCFSVPFMRHFYSWAKAVPATPAVINGMLKNGISPCLCPGGVREVGLITNRNEEINVFVRERKGFIRIAMSHGVPIVPVFAFGLRDAYQFWMLKNSVVQWIGRKIGFQPMVFTGVAGLPFAPGKSNCSFVNVIGKPIPCPKKPLDQIGKSDKDVDAVHDKYVKALQELYDAHKKDYGYDNVKLNIL